MQKTHDTVAVSIGAENRHPALRECALVSASYWVGDRRAGSRQSS